MGYDSGDSVLLITSKNSKDFGTGFVVACDDAGAHVLTCAHVVKDLGENNLCAATKDATLIEYGDPEFFDVALLYVPGLNDRSALPLKTCAQAGDEFRIRGFQRRSGGNFQYQPICGELASQAVVFSSDQRETYHIWNLKVQGGESLKFGYSGSPVIDLPTGGVVGVASEKGGNGERGVAIDMESISKWILSKNLKTGQFTYIDNDRDGRSTAVEHAATVGRSLEALAGLMKHDDVKSAVANVEASFRSVQKNIDRVINFKYVHAQLHRLQMDCCDLIGAELDRFPDAQSQENLERYEETLCDIYDRLLQLSSRPSLVGHLAWVPSFGRDVDKYKAALQSLSPEQLKKAHYSLDRVPPFRLPPLNTQLVVAAHDLKLDTLAEAMQKVPDAVDRIPGTEIEHRDRLKQFTDGTSALTKLHLNLMQLIDEHNGWQEVDIHLRRIEPTLRWDIDDLATSWPEIKDISRRFFEGRNEAWAIRLGADVMAVDKSLETGPLDVIRGFFVRYRRRATLRFVSVDTSLESICDQLRAISDRIGSVLRTIA